MKKQRNLTIGPGASSLILIVVILSMTVLGMLTLLNARNDERLSTKSAEVAERIYALNARAEEHFYNLDKLLNDCADEAEFEDALPKEFTYHDGVVSWREVDLYDSYGEITDEDTLETLSAYLPEGVTINIGKVCTARANGTETTTSPVAAQETLDELAKSLPEGFQLLGNRVIKGMTDDGIEFVTDDGELKQIESALPENFTLADGILYEIIETEIYEYTPVTDETTLRKISAALPEGYWLEGNTVYGVIEVPLRQLNCAAEVRFDDTSADRISWSKHCLVGGTQEDSYEELSEDENEDDFDESDEEFEESEEVEFEEEF